MKPNAFPKSQRLKSRKKLQQLFSQGKSVRVYPIRLVYLVEPYSSGEVKCSVGVSSKYFKKAVQRNRIRRLMREAYRLQQHEIKNFAAANNKAIALFFLYIGKEMPTYAQVFECVGNLLKKVFSSQNAMDTQNM